MSFIPIRQQAGVPDASDPQRLALIRDRWSSQDVLLAARDKSIEECVRVLAGRQWEVFSTALGRFVDVTEFMGDAERAFRKRPVVNRLFFWFMLTHARMTENPPIVGFQPSTADRKDALLAEAMDVIVKTLFHEVGMGEVLDRMMAWLISTGHVFLKSRVDFQRGAEALLPTLQPDGSYVMTQQREGAIAVDVLTALEVRGEWGAKPWHEKKWHIHRTLLTPDQVFQQYRIRVRPDATGMDVNGVGQHLSKLLFGAGNYGAVEGQGLTEPNALQSGANARADQGYVVVDELWELPDDNSPALDPTPENPYGKPGGRLLIACPLQNVVLWDSERPFRFKSASPIRSVPFVALPGRPTGTTPVEPMTPIQRAYNRGWQQLLDHRALMTSPIIELDADSGIEPSEIVIRPGAVIPTRKRPGVDPIRFLAPPQISGDVWRTQQMLADQLDMLGNVHGGMGNAPTAEASGALVQELRYNSDRFVGPAARRAAHEIARMVEDWVVMLPLIWPTERIISYAGEDNVVRTMTILPEMWLGAVNCIADPESMLPESRSERQQRVEHLFALGAFGDPKMDPKAISTFLELSRFPHLSRTVRPGGIHRVTAEHLLGRLLAGEPAMALPLFPWYEWPVHREVLEGFMSSPEYLQLEAPMQQQLILRLQMAKMMEQAQLAERAQEAATQAALTGAVQGAGQAGALSVLPAPAASPDSPEKR